MDKRIILAAGCAGLWIGLALSVGGGIGLGDLAPVGFVVGALGGGVLAYGLGSMVKGR
jgi:hypothetical protein